jgi:hypothetical protein
MKKVIKIIIVFITSVIGIVCLTFGILWYYAPIKLTNIKTMNATLSLRYSKWHGSYYILICDSRHDWCTTGMIAGGPSSILLDGLKKVNDIYEKNGTFVISVQGRQSIREKLEAKNVGFKFENSIIKRGIKYEHYTRIHTETIIFDTDVQKKEILYSIIVQYIPDNIYKCQNFFLTKMYFNRKEDFNMLLFIKCQIGEDITLK